MITKEWTEEFVGDQGTDSNAMATLHEILKDVYEAHRARVGASAPPCPEYLINSLADELIEALGIRHADVFTHDSLRLEKWDLKDIYAAVESSTRVQESVKDELKFYWEIYQDKEKSLTNALSVRVKEIEWHGIQESKRRILQVFKHLPIMRRKLALRDRVEEYHRRLQALNTEFADVVK